MILSSVQLTDFVEATYNATELQNRNEILRMLDGQIRRWIDPFLDRLGIVLARLGLSANAVTVAGFLFGVGSWIALAFQCYIVALVLISANRIADGLDGPLARRLGPTDLGGYLDIVLDFLFYSGVPFFFGLGRPEFAIPAAFLIFSFVGTGSSFLAFAAIAAKRQLLTERRGKKAIYYLGGLTEGTETIAIFVLICLFPELFDWFAWIFGGLCWLTTGIRIAMAVETFGGKFSASGVTGEPGAHMANRERERPEC